jgi:hypothetical protein
LWPLSRKVPMLWRYYAVEHQYPEVNTRWSVNYPWYCHVFGGMDWILDIGSLTTYPQYSELHVITALSLISTLYS